MTASQEIVHSMVGAGEREIDSRQAEEATGSPRALDSIELADQKDAVRVEMMHLPG